MDYKIYAVGSNYALREEIRNAVLLTLNYQYPVSSFCGDEIAFHLDGDLYVCNQTQYDNVARYISPDKIIVLNLMPVSRFFVQLAALPAGSDVYVFNNNTPYINRLIAECKSMGITYLNYHPLPYSELPHQKVCQLLAQADYIIGVDKLIEAEFDASERYKPFLRPHVQIIPASRVASVASACEIVFRVKTYLHSTISRQLGEILNEAKKSSDLMQLSDFSHTLDQLLQKVRADFQTQEQVAAIDPDLERSAMIQLGYGSDSSAAKSNTPQQA